MRRTRRGHSGMEFGGSGEDSFVAVVVTKLTGALLFILLLTMVIMALLPKAAEVAPKGETPDPADAPPLAITTPEDLPEAIAGRPYRVALAADNGRGHRKWAIVGTLPEGLKLVPETGTIEGTPAAGTPDPAALTLMVADASARVSKAVRLVVYKPDAPLSMPSKWAPSLPPIPWRAWFDQGFGFLVLWLVHLVGLQTLDGLKRWSLADAEPDDAPEADAIRRRFVAYRVALSIGSLAATAGLAAWLWWPR